MLFILIYEKIRNQSIVIHKGVFFMNKYGIHEDFKKFEKPMPTISLQLLPVINMGMGVVFDVIRLPDDLAVSKRKIKGYKDSMINITVFEPKTIETQPPCLLYFHGGAFKMKAAPYHKRLIYEYARQTPCKVVFVDYRLTPKYPFPYGVEDCYAAYEWVCNNTGLLAIDKDKIAVGGDSAGGALAAAVCHMARDRNMRNIRFQMLIYPVTDARQTTHSINKYTDTPLWDSVQNREMWKAYLQNGTPEHREYASPMEARSFHSLPPAYIEVSEFDCLHDEGVDYAEALRNGSVDVELNKTEKTIHGFEMAKDSEVVKRCVKERTAALKKAFAKDTNN